MADPQGRLHALHRSGLPQGVPVPGRDLTFSTLKQAQADGDLAALRQRGLRAGRVALDDLIDQAATR